MPGRWSVAQCFDHLITTETSYFPVLERLVTRTFPPTVAQLKAMVGSENRIKIIAADLVEHFENRQAVMPGKAMVVVMSRRIAVALYRELVALRPEWHGVGRSFGS